MSGLISKIALFFGSSFIWGLAFVKIKLPPLLGYIVSGVLLGPSLTKMMGKVEHVGMIGELGLVMLMFLAGLELDIDEFTSERNDPSMPIKAVLLQILLSFCFSIFIWILPGFFFEKLKNAIISSSIIFLSFFLLFSIVRKIECKYSINTTTVSKVLIIFSFLFLAISTVLIKSKILKTNYLFTAQTMILVSFLLALNSSAVVIKLLENRDKKNTKVGSSIIGILIAQDLALIAMLIALRSLTEGISWLGLFFKASTAIALLLIVKVLTNSRPTFLSESLDYIFERGKELASIFVIMLCFIFSSLSELIGLSDIYGAFIAGLLLGNVYKHSEVIIEMCEPISNIFMTVFFIWVGAMLNINELEKTWVLISLITVIMILFKFCSNFIIINFVQNRNPTIGDPLRTGLSKSCILLCSVLLTQMSEFSIVMINIVQKGLALDSMAFKVCDILKTTTIVSLSAGSVLTVFMKNTLYRLRYIR